MIPITPPPAPIPAPAPAPVEEAPAEAPAPAAAAAPADPSAEGQVLALVNNERAAHGCGALVANPGLASVARAHSADMRDRGYFSHDTPEGLDPIEGVVDWVSADAFGARSDDALYRFIRGFDGSVALGHHLYADDVDAKEAEGAWQAWLSRQFAS